MAALELFANQVQTTVSSGGTTAVTAGTVQTWTVSSSLGFPAASSTASPATFFRVTDPASSTEKMLVTNVSGTTWTVTRGAEGTTPVTHASGFTVQNVVTAAALEALVQLQTVSLVQPSGDTSGAADAAAVTAAVTALPSSGGTVRLAASAPWYIQCGQVSINRSNVYIDAEGCLINATGSGDMIRMYDSSSYGSRTVHGGGLLGNPVIDGAATTGAASALHIGDIFRVTVEASPQNFTQSSSDGVVFDNQYYWTEKIRAKVNASNCYRAVRFTQNPAVPGTPTSTGSFMRSDLDVYVNQGSASYDGIVWEKGTYCPGSVLDWKGNFGGSNTGSALASTPVRVSGSSPTGSSDSGTSSNIQTCLMSLDFECSTFTYTPFQYVIGSGSTIANCFGEVSFATAGNNFQPGTGYFGFMGVSDTLPIQVFDPWLFQGQLAIGSYASPASLASSGTISTGGSWAIVAPSAAVTGVIMGSGAYDGQVAAVFNDSAYRVTFAVPGTSHVATGIGETIVPHAVRLYLWSGTTNLWYPAAPSASMTIQPSGDTTGAADAAAVSAAIAALSGSPGVVRLSSNAPWYISCGSITCTTGQYVDATGCVIHATGAGDVFRWVDASNYGTRLSSTAGKVGGGGLTGNPAIDGTSTTGNSCAFHGGDILQLRCEAQALNFTAGTTSKGFWFDNVNWFTEQLYGRVYAQNCTTAVVFDNSSNPGGTATASFARADVDVYVAQVTDNVAQDGVTVQNGATVYDGHLGIFGNFVTTSAATTSAVLRITGQGAGGSNTNYSAVNSGELIIGVESDTALANGPYTVYYGSGNNEIYECYGTMDFAFGHFTASNLPGATVFVYTGTVNNDAVLGNFAWSFQNVVSAANGLQLAQYATATTVTANGQTINVGAVTYIRLTATAARTGLILNNSGGLYGQLCVLVNEGSFPLSFAAAGTSTVAAGLVIPPGAQQTYVYDHFTALWYPVQPQPVFTGADGLPQATTPAGLNSYVQQSQPSAATAVTVTAASIASLGSVTVPANDPVAGARYKVTAHGTLGTASAAPTATVDLRWGGTAGTAITSFVTGTTAIALAASMSAVPVLIEGEVEFYTATTCIGWLRMTWRNNGATGTAAVALASVTSAVTVTTSSAKALSLDWTWSATGTGTTITIASSSFERVA